MSDGIAVASACGECAGQIPGADEYAPGQHMGIIHASHLPDLAALGWIITRYPHEPPDVACPHYHAANWHDGDGDQAGETKAITHGHRSRMTTRGRRHRRR